MKKVLATVVLTVGLTLAAPTLPAVAVKGDAGHSPGIVTHKEFRNLKKGMTLARVRGIVDAKGKVSHQGYGYRMQEFNTRSEWGWVWIDFEHKRGKWRMTGKYAYWG